MIVSIRTTATAAAIFFASVTASFADGWGDNTTYRNTGWASATPDVRASAARKAKAAPARAQRTRVVVETSDEDRPQRRSRTARVDRAPTERGSIGSGSVGGSTGVASYYWQPQRVASGGWFNPNAMTAAHKTLPFGTRVRVTHLGNGRSVDVTINDRGPFIAGRIIDVSRAAASAINMTGQGVARVRMTVLGR
jgi:rare lipoprotein A